MMGAGKSTVGRLLAAELNREFIDTDDHIERFFGPVKNIFAKKDGEQEFQQIEEKLAQELSQKSNLVIATGGRFFINHKNIQLLKSTGWIVCLNAELVELVHRLKNPEIDTYRPRFLAANDKLALMQTLQKQSEPYFAQFQQINTTSREPADIRDEILKGFRSYP